METSDKVGRPSILMTLGREEASAPGRSRIAVEIVLDGVARRLPVELDARAVLWLAAEGLEASRDLLRRLHGTLPEPPEEMLLYEVPYDVEAEIRGTVETVLGQELGPVIERLRETATVTTEQLRSHWEEHRHGGGHPGE